MAEKFDPYYRWLGIPPAEQPPNLYRLLGVQPFESDREVIDAVANRHITYLQEITSGPNLTLAQQLLNELAGARRTLLKPEQKAKYDAELKQKLAAKDAPPAARKPEPRRSGVSSSAVTDDSNYGKIQPSPYGSGHYPLVARSLDDHVDVAGRETGKVSGDESAIDNRRQGGSTPGTAASGVSKVIQLDDAGNQAPGSGSGVVLDEFEKKPGVNAGSSNIQLSSLSATNRARQQKKRSNAGVIVGVIAVVVIAGGVAAGVFLSGGKTVDPPAADGSVQSPPATNKGGAADAGNDGATDFGSPVLATSGHEDFSFEVESLVTWLHGDNSKSPSADGVTGRSAAKKLGWKNLSSEKRGGVMVFDGKTAVKIPRAAYYDFTITMWLKTTQKQPGNGDKKWNRGAVLLCSAAKGKNRDFGLSLFRGQPMFHMQGQKLNVSADTDLASGGWRHLAVVYHQPAVNQGNQGFAKIYIDGRQQSEQSFKYQVSPPTTREIILGGLDESKQTASKFIGSVDELRVYNYPLQDDEIKGLADPAPPVHNDIWFFSKGQQHKQQMKAVHAKIKSKTPPDLQRRLYSLRVPRNFADDYGQRLSCWITPPQSGVCKFQAEADDAVEFAVTDVKKEGGQEHAYKLNSGRRYQVELLHKEDAGSDFCTLQWQPPGATKMQQIPASALHANR